MTREEITAEIDEKAQDLEVFSQARALIRNRVLEIIDSKSSLTPLPRWSGTDAVLGSLDLAIHAMERTLEELHEHRREIESRPTSLRLVTDEEER